MFYLPVSPPKQSEVFYVYSHFELRLMAEKVNMFWIVKIEKKLEWVGDTNGV